METCSLMLVPQDSAHQQKRTQKDGTLFHCHDHTAYESWVDEKAG